MNNPTEKQGPYQHTTNVTIVGDGAFQYCEDCGAVRSRSANRLNEYEPWYMCNLCRLPGAA